MMPIPSYKALLIGSTGATGSSLLNLLLKSTNCKHITTLVKALNAFQVKMVSGLIKNNAIGVLEHHPADHATDFLSSAQHICFFQNVIAAE